MKGYTANTVEIATGYALHDELVASLVENQDGRAFPDVPDATSQRTS